MCGGGWVNPLFIARTPNHFFYRGVLMDSLSVGCGSALSRFVYDFVRSRVKVSYSEVIFECRKCGFERDSVEHVIDFLLVSGKFFEPKSGVLEFVDY